ncbi:plasmid stabilization protein [Hydrogenophaga soli]
MEFAVAALTIRNVDDALKTQLRIRAAQHGVSMEEEARRILRDALARAGAAPEPMGQRLLTRFAQAATADFALPERQTVRTPPQWTEGA